MISDAFASKPEEVVAVVFVAVDGICSREEEEEE